jgi:hypothetical protein
MCIYRGNVRKNMGKGDAKFFNKEEEGLRTYEKETQNY